MDVLAKFLQQLINGIHVGSIYALIALGIPWYMASLN